MFVARCTVSVLTLCFVVASGTHAVAQAQPRVRPGTASPQRSDALPRGTIKDAQQAIPQSSQAPLAQVDLIPQGPPEGFELTEAEAKRLDQMLDFWERKTSGVKTMSAQFGRWVYDPVFGPKTDAKTFTTGEIRYAAPDKGMIQEKALGKQGSGLYDFNEEMKQNGAKWPYEERQDAFGEHWVCDGKSVFEFNHKTRQLVETKLPPEMQGQAIADGPLPFMFGAKAETIKRRYWVREIPQKSPKAPYQLELVPKGRGADFSRVRIKLDYETFLPTEMVLYDLNSVGRSAYAFKNLKADGVQDNLKNFLGSFVSPKTPAGWERIVHDASKPAPVSRQTQAPAPVKR